MYVGLVYLYMPCFYIDKPLLNTWLSLLRFHYCSIVIYIGYSIEHSTSQHKHQPEVTELSRQSLKSAQV